MEPTLYSKVNLVPTPGWPKLTTKCPLVLFYCTIMEIDKLAHTVREITIEGERANISYVWYNTEDGNQKSDGKAEWLAQVLPDRQARVHKIGRRRFYQIIRTDMLIGLLILRLKKLERLRLQYMHSESCLPSALYGEFLKELKNVRLKIGPLIVSCGLYRTIRSIRAPKSITTCQLRGLLELPHIESIYCTAVECVDGEETNGEEVGGNTTEVFGPLESPCKSLIRLTFRESRLKPSTLRRILAAPRIRIRTFHF